MAVQAKWPHGKYAYGYLKILKNQKSYMSIMYRPIYDANLCFHLYLQLTNGSEWSCAYEYLKQDPV